MGIRLSMPAFVDEESVMARMGGFGGKPKGGAGPKMGAPAMQPPGGAPIGGGRSIRPITGAGAIGGGRPPPPPPGMSSGAAPGGSPIAGGFKKGGSVGKLGKSDNDADDRKMYNKGGSVKAK